MKKGLNVLLTLVLILSLTTTGLAQDKLTKLERGAINTVTGWVEVPKEMYDETIDTNVLSGLTIGLGKGVCLGVLRTGAGIYDIVTFPFAIPEGYVPVVEPEFVFSATEEIIEEPVIILETV